MERLNSVKTGKKFDVCGKSVVRHVVVAGSRMVASRWQHHFDIARHLCTRIIARITAGLATPLRQAVPAAATAALTTSSMTDAMRSSWRGRPGRLGYPQRGSRS
jgi:hypothetical protein